MPFLWWARLGQTWYQQIVGEYSVAPGLGCYSLRAGLLQHMQTHADQKLHVASGLDTYRCKVSFAIDVAFHIVLVAG